MYAEYAVLAVFAHCYSLVAGRFERSIISGPMVFVIAGFIMGPFVLGWLQDDVSRSGLRVFADLTLALVLFCDASSSDLSVLKRSAAIPSRMLLLGLPGVILLGVVVGAILFPGLSIFEVAALATMLAATDAALGKAVVTNKIVPARLREGLNIESGLNDGICVPILFVFLALAAGKVGEDGVSGMAMNLVLEEIGIGFLFEAPNTTQPDRIVQDFSLLKVAVAGFGPARFHAQGHHAIRALYFSSSGFQAAAKSSTILHAVIGG